MPRSPRKALGGIVYHVLNRGNNRAALFDKDEDYDAFERILEEACVRFNMRLLAYCLMPNHWHLLVWPRGDGDLSRFMAWVTLTHTQRRHAHLHTAGAGHIYQGRYKSFPTQSDDHFYAVARYVERNALRAGLVRRAQDWRWCSLRRRSLGPAAQAMLAAWPLDRPRDWPRRVNQPESEAELKALRRCVSRGCPFGGETWTTRTTQMLGLEATLRPRGRPRRDKTQIGT